MTEITETLQDNWPFSVVRSTDSPLSELLATVATPYERVRSDLLRMQDERLVKRASKPWLAYLGAEVGVELQTGESLEHYRKRVQLRNKVAGTPCSMAGFGEVVVKALETSGENFTVYRDHSTELGAVIVATSSQVINNATLTASEIERELEQAVQADRRVVLNIKGSAEYDDTEKGFGKTYSTTL